MNEITTVFQLEIRYDHILNFSQIARKIFAPYVKLTKSLKVEKANTLEERIILNFEDDDYLIIISWNTILIKGQGDYSKFTAINSPFTFPFLDMTSKLKELSEFGSINNILFASNHIKELDISEDKLISLFFEKSLSACNKSILDNVKDMAITLENQSEHIGTSFSYGPYFGSEEIKKRNLKPVNQTSLGDIDFLGIIAEYKEVYETNKFDLGDFKSITEKAKKSMKTLWKIF